MHVQNNDWLDEKLARMDYLPDEGFTSRVMEQLPKRRPARTGQLRWGIMAMSTVIAFCLFVLQAVPFVRNLNPVIGRYLSPHALDHFVAFAHDPVVLYSIAAALVIACFATIPFLNRLV